MRHALIGLTLFAAALTSGCMLPQPGSCDLSPLFGGAPSSECNNWTGYRSDAAYALGVPYETTDPTSGATIIIPGSTLRAQQALRPLEQATRNHGGHR